MTVNNSQTNASYILSALFGSKARAAVLRTFLIDPIRAYYQRQLEGATRQPIRAVQRELERLTSIGLLYRRSEGNRAYYQVDVNHPLFPELRGMVLKLGSDVDRLRGHLAMDADVRLAFLDDKDRRVLVVTGDERTTGMSIPGPYQIVRIKLSTFLQTLGEDPGALAAYLKNGVDLLGRREDIVWRRIEQAGFDVLKGEGVP